MSGEVPKAPSEFEDFDFKTLNDKSFKEDAVREEIIAPILRSLGYRPSGRTRVLRSHNLTHPTVMFGTKKRRISIIPDYTLFVDDAPLLVLDAKAPTESIRQSDHVLQAYSYAIHPEVRSDHFALCNGHELVLYSVGSRDPVFAVNISQVQSEWPRIVRHLGPNYLAHPELRHFMLDYGLHLMRAGIDESVDLWLVDHHLQDITLATQQVYTSSTNSRIGGLDFVVSLDYGKETLDSIVAALPEGARNALLSQLSRQPFRADIGGKITVSVQGHLGAPQRAEFEEFVPIIVDTLHNVQFDPTATLVKPASDE